MSLRLTVATFNIRNGIAPDGRNHWFLRRPTTVAWIRFLDADVLGLQEAYGFQRRRLERDLPEWEAVGRGRNRRFGGEQVPVFVRSPFVIDRVVHRWFGATPDVPGTRMPDTTRPRLTTVLECRHAPSGRRIRVANTHLDDAHEANRLASARQLVDDLDDSLPTVLMGDFNANPARSDLFDVLAEAGWRRLPYEGASGNGWRHGTGHGSGPIDHILVRDGAGGRWGEATARLVSATAGRLPSDHWPVVADLELLEDRPAAGRSRT